MSGDGKTRQELLGELDSIAELLGTAPEATPNESAVAPQSSLAAASADVPLELAAASNPFLPTSLLKKLAEEQMSKSMEIPVLDETALPEKPATASVPAAKKPTNGSSDAGSIEALVEIIIERELAKLREELRKRVLAQVRLALSRKSKKR